MFSLIRKRINFDSLCSSYFLEFVVPVLNVNVVAELLGHMGSNNNNNRY